METLNEEALLDKKARLLAIVGLWAEHEDKEDAAKYLKNARHPKIFEKIKDAAKTHTIQKMG